MALLPHPFFHLQIPSKYLCFSCPESITYLMFGTVIEVSEILVDMMNFLVPAGAALNILSCYSTGKEEYSLYIKKFEEAYL